MDISAELKQIVQKYLERTGRIEFARIEQEQLAKLDLNDPEQLKEAVGMIASFSTELNLIFEHCPDSVFVCDGEGVSSRINKAFEATSRITRHKVFGKDVGTLEEEGVFKPSVCALVLKEGRSVAVLQKMDSGKDTVVTGAPIRDETGNIVRVVTNARLLSEINSITNYLEGTRNHFACEKKSRNPRAKAHEKIIAVSGAMQEVLRIAEKARDTDTNILITGDTGVGKGVLARFIHETSARGVNPFVEINCGAIPDALLESELFGYESGAFTGAASKGKPGLIETAEGGTLFLDEISELPLLLQVKLLHFIQNKKMIRVGGTKEIPADVRVIAASNKDLWQQVEEDKFRKDLYYRLNVVQIDIPPLARRREDIIPMAKHFVSVFNRKYYKNVSFNNTFYEKLEQFDWPGNIRQLENHIERRIVMDETEEPFSGPADPDRETPRIEKPAAAACSGTLKEAVEALEERLVKDAYEKYRSSYKVAQALAISQSSAYRKIRKYVEGTGGEEAEEKDNPKTNEIIQL